MDHETTDHQPPRRSSGRRKFKCGGGNGGDAKKHKQPRRGMGVAKLERLREQGEVVTEPDRAGSGFPLPFPEMNHLRFQQHQLQSCGPSWNPVGFPGLDCRILQSHGEEKCFSLQCNACHKKKKINGAAVYKCGDHRRFLGLDFGDALIHHNLEPPQVDVVAVHRKGAGGLEGGNNVVMEYDFFPPAARSGRRNDVVEGEMRNSGSFDGVDLSLKLSY
ncbi:hypothetical protein SASPL_146249 [Salvia splendens]|uniref:Uncharacterized protein n=1 Tax=Salvia splendens TaxID=180675 RepID=A0A8X8WCW5_SALSN|nr:uncharacterized protein LOC121776549 [Salvia splendens]KAG6392043.1 hypothetical protein SASPL_146249 [Salvia splendens]